MATQQILGSSNTVTTSVQDEFGDRTARIVKVEGLYSTLEASRASLVVSECPSGYTVETSNLASTQDGMGCLTLRCVRYGANGDASLSPVRTTFRVDMLEVCFDLEDHPHLKNERDTILKWLSTDEAKRFDTDSGDTHFYFQDGDEELTEITTSGYPLSHKFCVAYVAGIKSFNRYYPVIEKISVWSNPPGLLMSGRSFTGGSPTFSANVGTYDAPPLTLNGFESANWFKSKDSWVQNSDSTWTRTEQWTYTPESSSGENAWIYTELTASSAS